MGTTDPTPRRRRLDHRKHPWNTLPALTADRTGTVHVIRGPLPTDRIPRGVRAKLNERPGVAHTVFINRLGQTTLRPDGDLIPIGIDYTRIGWFGLADTRVLELVPLEADRINKWDSVLGPDDHYVPRRTSTTLTEYADEIRYRAERDCIHRDRLLAAAAYFEALSADQWELAPNIGRDPRTFWAIYDISPGPDYAPKAPRRP